MGGPGSGSYYRSGSKDRVEDCLSADVRRWHRKGLLAPGASFTATWGRLAGDSSIGVRALGGPGDRDGRADALRLSYSVGSAGGKKEDVEYVVPLEWTACNFGGSRPWFLCPSRSCRRRVALLYLSGGYFLCRTCQDLAYASQRERGGSLPALRRCQKIRAKLDGVPDVHGPFPERPKGMHMTTYARLYLLHEEAYAEYAAALAVEMTVMSARFDAIAERGR